MPRAARPVFCLVLICLVSVLLFQRPGPCSASALRLSRPHAQPVTVPLFHDLAFTDFTPKPFRYTPPAGPKSWARIVLVVDFSVTPGRQFDRTAQISIGKTNVFFGTTEEPSQTVSPAWHVERDLTDYGTLMRSPQTGEVDLGNIVNATYTGVIHGSASLEFFPADSSAPAPETPDVVLPLPTPTGTAATLATSADSLAGTFTFPRNVTRAFLDVITESQHNDEFWYTNVPDDLSAKLHQYGGTAFRQAEITVDGKLAGVAPVFPWIYTGGIDPSLWRPIPGVQTLNFVPFRVDLTPFAGELSDGRPHRIALSVFNARDYFLATATLLLYCDPARHQVTGAVTQVTLSAAPAPVVRQSVTDDGKGNANGTVSVTAFRTFAISGYVLTSHGRVETRIVQNIGFSNRQRFRSAGAQNTQDISQDSTLSSVTTTRYGGHVRERRKELDSPLTLASTAFTGAGQSNSQTTTVRQGYHQKEQFRRDGRLLFSNALTEEVSPSDVIRFDAKGHFLGHWGQRSTRVFFYDDSRGRHSGRIQTARDGALTGDSYQDQ